jgi:hypothetical protein
MVIRAVISPLDFGDFRSTRMRPGGLDRHHHGFRAGIAEAHLRHTADPVTDQLGESDLGFGWQAERRSQGELSLSRLHEGRVRVAMDQGCEIVDAVDPRDTVDIPNSAAFTAGRINGKRLHVDRRARVATRQALSGAGVKVTRLRGVLWIRHRTSNHVHVFSS